MQDVMGGVTETQKDLLLRGLRFVRRSVKLGMDNPTDETDSRRATELQQVEALISQIDSLNPGDC